MSMASPGTLGATASWQHLVVPDLLRRLRYSVVPLELAPLPAVATPARAGQHRTTGEAGGTSFWGRTFASCALGLAAQQRLLLHSGRGAKPSRGGEVETLKKAPRNALRKQYRWKKRRGKGSKDREGMPVALKEALTANGKGFREMPPLDPNAVGVRVEGVSWSPAVEGAGDDGRTTTKKVLESINFQFSGPEKVGLIGANGCGKSTMLLMIQGHIEPTEGQVIRQPSGMRMAYMQQEADLDETKNVFQELHSVFRDRSLAEIDEDLQRCGNEGEATAELEALVDERVAAEVNLRRVERLIPELGMADRREMQIQELSGGWQMRVALGKIILGDPDLILLDEPTNHIDLETVEFMEHFLRSQRVGMVIVSHDRHFLNRVCTKIVEIYKGRARSYTGNYVKYLKARDASLAQEWRVYQKYQERVAAMKKQLRKLEERFVLETAAQKRQVLEKLLENPVPKPEVNELEGFRFSSSVVATTTADNTEEDAEAAASKVTEEAEGSNEVDDDDFWGDDTDLDEAGAPADEEVARQEQQEMPVLLDIQNLRVAYPDNQVLDGISFTVKQGEKVAIVGPNGCGKSTLVRAVVGDLGEQAVVEGKWSYTDAGSAYFPQRLAEFFNYENTSVKEALYKSCSVSDIDSVGGLEVVLKRLRLDGITADQPVWSLSGGEKARVAFAQFLLQPVALLILDEPTNHLDIPTRELLEDALKAFTGSAVVVSHDRFFLREFATRVVEIVDGGVRDHPSWEAYAAAAPPQWTKATQAEESFIKQDAHAAHIWQKKKMARLKKQQGNVGLRRLSKRVDEFIDEQETPKRPSVVREERVVKELIGQGLDPALLGPHAPSAPSSPSSEPLDV